MCCFDYVVLQVMVYDLVCQLWGGVLCDLLLMFVNFILQVYNSIQYDVNYLLWNNIEECKLDIQFFYVGMGFCCCVWMFFLDVSIQQVCEIYFCLELFKYNDVGVDICQLEGQFDFGFVGFWVFKVLELVCCDIVVFFGVSYFCVVDSIYQYGLLVCGLVVDIFIDILEEFFDFMLFWFEMVKGDVMVFIVYVLLDSLSIIGVYKFIIYCQDIQVIMDVENYLYVCKDIKQLGIVLMISMFSCGNNEWWMCDIIYL